MNEKINKLIPVAIAKIKSNRQICQDDKVPSEFKGYVSSMGASIIQTGLLPTLAFFQNDENKKAKSSELLNVILEVLKDLRQDSNDSSQKLIQYVINKTKKQDINENEGVGYNDLDFNKLLRMEKDISDILIAIKLALRTFKFSE